MEQINSLSSKLKKNLTLQVTSLRGDENNGEFVVENNIGESFTYGSEKDLANYRKIDFGSNCVIGISEASSTADENKADFYVADNLRIMSIHKDKYFVKVELRSNDSYLNVSIPEALYFGASQNILFMRIGKMLHVTFSFWTLRESSLYYKSNED